VSDDPKPTRSDPKPIPDPSELLPVPPPKPEGDKPPTPGETSDESEFKVDG
jgi:hypothetical protein